jgi:hypothetical protein
LKLMFKLVVRTLLPVILHIVIIVLITNFKVITRLKIAD